MSRKSFHRYVIAKRNLPPYSLLQALLLSTMLFVLATCQRSTTQAVVAPSSEALVDSLRWPSRFGLGRPATEAEIAAWNTDVRPDGTGLPPGSGTVATGRLIYAAKCSSCHGQTGTEGPNARLVGAVSATGPNATNDEEGSKTIGNYWPYATTVYDYINRAMPFNAPGSLSSEEVYSLTAFLLHANGLIDSSAVLNAQTLPKVVMPAQKRFVPDDRRGGAEIR